MRKNIISSSIFLLTISTLILGSCNKDIDDRSYDYPSLQPAGLDANAGDWKTYMLVSPDQIALDSPGAVTSPGYIADLNEIKGYQTKGLTGKEKNIINYWKAGSVLRWNEILRELVARHNLPPYQNDDGSYPAPNQANPFAYPQFPFSNPPFAARAYAYVSAAQYDALVAAWHYKQLYHRMAPYTVDSSIQALIPKSDLPSYPSEDAVVAGASIEVMKLMFPTEVDFIQQKAAEQMQARIMSGANVRSDLTAGQTLGTKVAQLFTARARTDRAGQAGGNPAYWKLLEDNTVAKGEVCWFSLEFPKRPPQLPLFNKVKSFNLDSAGVIAMRPPPPPLTGSEQFKKETDEVLWYTQHDTRERLAIVHFWADGAGTYAPPGHWNAIASDEFVKQNFSEVRWARNLALINTAMMDAAIVCWDTKYFYFNQRPSQANEMIKTLTGIPNFPAYVSGHSMFSGAAAQVLSHILPDRASMFQNMASEASSSRLYGGIHYRSDISVGLSTGQAVGNVSVQRATVDGAE
jgi:PAP2 superfamily